MPSVSLISPSTRKPPGALPWMGSAFSLLRDPVGYLERCRSEVGDTFVTRLFDYEVLFVFSPEGVKNLWAAPERELSKGLADFEMIRMKVPDELFAGRRTRPHDLFARDDVAEYLAHVEEAVDAELDELGAGGETELFSLTRRVSHRVGLASWGGLTGASASHLGGLIRSLDALDGADAFVHPIRTLIAKLRGKREACRALAELEEQYRDILVERQKSPPATLDLFDRICAKWEDVGPEERQVGIARDVVLTHLGSMSNLFAANAWTVIHLLEKPHLLARVREGDTALLQSCTHEAIRLHQRSIVLRRAMQETTLSDETETYHLGPGAFAATMMPNTNRSAAPGLDDFDPGRYAGPRFTGGGELPARELVTTFGHGKHSCPAMRFSIESIQRFVMDFVTRYEIEPLFRNPQPLRNQIGGVARADRPCRVRYARRG